MEFGGRHSALALKCRCTVSSALLLQLPVVWWVMWTSSLFPCYHWLFAVSVWLCLMRICLINTDGTPGPSDRWLWPATDCVGGWSEWPCQFQQSKNVQAYWLNLGHQARIEPSLAGTSWSGKEVVVWPRPPPSEPLPPEWLLRIGTLTDLLPLTQHLSDRGSSSFKQPMSKFCFHLDFNSAF